MDDIEKVSEALKQRSAELHAEAAIIRAKAEALAAKAKLLNHEVEQHQKRLDHDRKQG